MYGLVTLVTLVRFTNVLFPNFRNSHEEFHGSVKFWFSPVRFQFLGTENLWLPKFQLEQSNKFKIKIVTPKVYFNLMMKIQLKLSSKKKNKPKTKETLVIICIFLISKLRYVKQVRYWTKYQILICKTSFFAKSMQNFT